MKLRKFELKKVPITDEIDQKLAGATFDYRIVTIDILRSRAVSPDGSAGLDVEQIAKSVYLCGKIREAVEKSETHVLLSKEDYEYLRGRVLSFRAWSRALDEVHNYINYIKDLKEEDFDVTAKA